MARRTASSLMAVAGVMASVTAMRRPSLLGAALMPMSRMSPDIHSQVGESSQVLYGVDFCPTIFSFGEIFIGHSVIGVIQYFPTGHLKCLFKFPWFECLSLPYPRLCLILVQIRLADRIQSRLEGISLSGVKMDWDEVGS